MPFALPNMADPSLGGAVRPDAAEALLHFRRGSMSGRGRRQPTVLIEVGENGRTDDAFVEPVVAGVVNLLRVLKMTEGLPSGARTNGWTWG